MKLQQLVLILSLAYLTSATASPCGAQLPPSKVPSEGAEESSKQPSERSAIDFSWFGFVNWGYGVSDEHTYRGVPEDGTADLRTVALQFRLKPTQRDEFVLQLASERVGTSPSNELRDDIELDWLYYRRVLSDEFSVRLGRVPLPIGIYNEIADVGTVLPFYRASGLYYGDGTWTSDSVDGLVLRYEAPIGRWGLDGYLYAGESERIETAGNLFFQSSDIEDMIGGWAWIETPVDGLRFGFGFNRFHVSDSILVAPGVTSTEENSYFSIDADFDPVTIRFEYSRRTLPGGKWAPWYIEIDTKITERFRLAGRYERGNLFFDIPFIVRFDDTFEDLYSVGARYALQPNLIVKLEYQWFKGYGQIEDIPLNIFLDDPVETELSIVSIAWSF